MCVFCREENYRRPLLRFCGGFQYLTFFSFSFSFSFSSYSVVLAVALVGSPWCLAVSSTFTHTPWNTKQVLTEQATANQVRVLVKCEMQNPGVSSCFPRPRACYNTTTTEARDIEIAGGPIKPPGVAVVVLHRSRSTRISIVLTRSRP